MIIILILGLVTRTSFQCILFVACAIGTMRIVGSADGRAPVSYHRSANVYTTDETVMPGMGDSREATTSGDGAGAAAVLVAAPR